MNLFFKLIFIFLVISIIKPQIIWPLNLRNKIDINCTKGKDISRVVVAGGSLTEIIYELGYFRNLVAVDITSKYPLEAKNLPSIGYVRSISVEGILSMNPSIVIGEHDMGPVSVVDKIRSLGIDIRVIPEIQTVYGIKQKILCIESIFKDHMSNENVYLNQLEEEIKELELERINSLENPKNILLILSILGSSPIIAGQNTSGNSFIKLMNFDNAINSFYGWKPVGIEHLIKINPDVIILTKRGSSNYKNINELKNSPIFRHTDAAKKNRIYAFDGMSMLGFSPRTIDLAKKSIRRILDNE